MEPVKKGGKLARAVEAFGKLPTKVGALGRPVSVHPPNALARLADHLPKALARLADYPASRTLVLALTIGLMVVGLVLTIPFFLAMPLGTAPPFVWLMFASLCLLCGLWVAVYWWGSARGGRDGQGRTPTGFLVFDDALVRVRGGEFEVIRWDDVEELRAPVNAGCWRVVARDGRHIDLTKYVERDGDLIQGTVERVTARLLPRFLAEIDSGRTVMFGKFGVSRRAVVFKEKKLAWKDVTQMTLVTGRVCGLKIFGGGLGLLPWCFYDLRRDPNGQVAYEVVRRVAPAHLLKPA